VAPAIDSHLQGDVDSTSVHGIAGQSASGKDIDAYTGYYFRHR